jgi:hypothetical protein
VAKAAVAAATAVVKDLAKGAKVATVVEVVAKAVAGVDSERTRSRGAPQQELLPVAGGIDAPSPSLFLFVCFFFVFCSRLAAGEWFAQYRKHDRKPKDTAWCYCCFERVRVPL